MSRQSQLLKAAAAAMENGEDPFHESFLGANEVTLDECFDMADLLALGAQVMAWAIEHPKEASAFARNGANGMHLDMVTRALASTTGKPFAPEGKSGR